MTRRFEIAELPEQISIGALENWKLVLTGGAGPSDENLISIALQTRYEIANVGSSGLATVATPSAFLRNAGFTTIDEDYSSLVEGNLPLVLGPGTYQLTLDIGASLDDRGNGGLQTAGFLEFGGITGFSGFDLSLTGTPVPEPSTAVLVLTGLAVMSRRLRV